jgi:uncharacterized RDD family membrane protein YckC
MTTNANNQITNQITAALWRRIAAMLYDSLLIFAIWMIVGFVVLSAFGIEQARTIEGDVVVLDTIVKNTLFAAMLLSAFLFFGWFWTNSGQTLGMQAWRIRVVSVDGHCISWQQALQRFLVAPFALGLGGIGYWWALLDAQKRSWPDLASASKVIKTAP